MAMGTFFGADVPSAIPVKNMTLWPRSQRKAELSDVRVTYAEAIPMGERPGRPSKDPLLAATRSHPTPEGASHAQKAHPTPRSGFPRAAHTAGPPANTYLTPT